MRGVVTDVYSFTLFRTVCMSVTHVALAHMSRNRCMRHIVCVAARITRRALSDQARPSGGYPPTETSRTTETNLRSEDAADVDGARADGGRDGEHVVVGHERAILNQHS